VQILHLLPAPHPARVQLARPVPDRQWHWSATESLRP